MNLRVIYFDGTNYFDYSAALSSYADQTKNFSMPTDGYLYIGSRLPFNNLYFEMSAPSTTANVELEIEYYDTTAWRQCKDIIDETIGFTQSGHVQFVPDLDYGWGMRSTNYNGDTVPELTDFYILNLYWLRISVSDALAIAMSTPTIKFIGNVFSNDTDLSIEFPDLVETSVLTSFKAEKTNWKEQTAKAGELIVEDLINKNIMHGAGQILDWRDFKGASVQKVAEIIFKSFGDDHKDDMIEARKEYNERLTKRLKKIDKNNDAVEQPSERCNPQGMFTR